MHTNRPLNLHNHTNRPSSSFKFINTEDLQHLITTLEQQYTIKVKKEGKKYLGYTINHDKQREQIVLTMPNVIPAAIRNSLNRLQFIFLHPMARQVNNMHTTMSHHYSTMQISDSRKRLMAYFFTWHWPSTRLFSRLAQSLQLRQPTPRSKR